MRKILEARVGAEWSVQGLRVELEQRTGPTLVGSLQTSERFILVSQAAVRNCKRPQWRHVLAIRPMQ